MFSMGNNIKRDANKSSKYKTLFEVSENDNNNNNNNNNNNKHKKHTQGTRTYSTALYLDHNNYRVKFCSLSTDCIVLILTEVGECRYEPCEYTDRLGIFHVQYLYQLNNFA